ncbi:copper-binding protein [Pseudoduganella sp. FT93W]|uniref:Copper-binding protein n=1 Tax=Duganella fentianensis TaxID=2692177 RepID=A0A845I3D0_9BURK|nr:cupredoxin family copper-binding protein [Duganella fentianensis]MYN47742.1 copper-binding protein [Duganella fentianensis]
MRTLPHPDGLARCCGKGALVLALLAALCAPSQTLAASATHRVIIEAMQFSPQVLEIKAGDTVEWINKDPFPHDAVSRVPQFTSGTIPAGARWTFVARRQGSFAYACTLHPMMQARIIVK